MRFLAPVLFFVLALAPVQALSARVVRVAVVDTGLDLTDARFRGRLCETGHKDYTGNGIADTHGHGTHVAGLIVGNAGDAKYCLLIYNFYIEGDNKGNMRRMTEAFHEAARQGATIVNFSGGGPDFNEGEYLSIRRAPQITFFTAAGNEKQNIDESGNAYYPASYQLPNIKVVGGLDETGAKGSASNWGHKVGYWELGENVLSTLPGGRVGRMSGTSQATAIATGKFLAGTLKPRACPKPYCVVPVPRFLLVP